MLNELSRVFTGLNLSGNTEDPFLLELNEMKNTFDRAILKEKIECQEAEILEKDDQAYKATQWPFIEKEMPDFETRIIWELDQPPQIFEGDILRKINDSALQELLRLAQRFMELEPPLSSVKTLPNNISVNRFQDDFYYKIEPIFKKIWPKVMGTDTLEHIMKGCPASEKETFLDQFRHEVNACTTFKDDERHELCKFIEKVYMLIYADKKEFF